jgi:hypothetical protein
MQTNSVQISSADNRTFAYPSPLRSNSRCGATRPNRFLLPLAQPIEASLTKPDLNASTSVSISASVIGVENVHVPVLIMLQPSLQR